MTPAPAASLWRHRDFRLYWAGQAISVTGSGVTTVATPVIAILLLHASTLQVSLLAVAGRLPPLLFALPAGALLDRARKRPIALGCDLASALTALTIPTAQLLHALTLGQLYAVSFTIAVFATVGDNASTAYLPTLLAPGQVLEGNGKLGAANSLADTLGTNLGGVLVAALGAARALLLDAASFLISAVCLWAIRAPEPPPHPRNRDTGSWAEIRAGLSYTLTTPLVRPLVLANAATSTLFAGNAAIWALYLLRDLDWSPTALAAVMGLGGLGGFTGAALAPHLTRALGPAKTMLTALALNPLSEVPLLLIHPGLAGQLFLGAAMFVQCGCGTLHGGIQRSTRQLLCPPEMQGRAQASGAWLAFALRPAAALAAGAAGTWLGLHTTLVAITVLLAAPLIILGCSSVRHLHALPAPATV